MKTGDALICTDNAKPMGEHPGMQTSNSKENGGGIDDVPSVLTKNWIVSDPKYKHLFTGIGHFKCDPVKKTRMSSAILMTPWRPSTMFLMQASNTSVAFDNPIASTLYK